MIGQALRLVAVGVAIGLAGAYGLARALGSQLYQTNAFDPATFAAMAAMLAATSAVACWIPARRALRVDPVVALRYE